MNTIVWSLVMGLGFFGGLIATAEIVLTIYFNKKLQYHQDLFLKLSKGEDNGG